MGRTNIVLDERLVKQAMQLSGARTKRQAVDLALRELVALVATMIVVDTGVWADWFNGAQSVEVDRLDQALADEEVGLTPLILTEVLQGFRADADFERARTVLARLPVLELDVDGHVAAARLFRLLRRKGSPVAAPSTASLRRRASWWMRSCSRAMATSQPSLATLRCVYAAPDYTAWTASATISSARIVSVVGTPVAGSQPCST